MTEILGYAIIKVSLVSFVFYKNSEKERKMKKVLGLLMGVFLLGAHAQSTGPLPIPAEKSSGETVASLKEKIIEIQNRSELGVDKFTLCSNILGYGQYVAIPENKVKEGSKVYFYYEPVNLFTNKKDGVYGIWFTQDIIVKGQDGSEILNSKDALNFNYQTVSPVLDVFATNSLDLGKLPPGIYQFVIVLNDRYRNKSVSYGYNFEIIQ